MICERRRNFELWKKGVVRWETVLCISREGGGDVFLGDLKEERGDKRGC